MVREDTSSAPFALICTVNTGYSATVAFTMRRSWRASVFYGYPEPDRRV